MSSASDEKQSPTPSSVIGTARDNSGELAQAARAPPTRNAVRSDAGIRWATRPG
ncbi:hypothetical protein ACFPRL_30760 [Pseudoclavibacter helvolus]